MWLDKAKRTRRAADLDEFNRDRITVLKRHAHHGPFADHPTSFPSSSLKQFKMNDSPKCNGSRAQNTSLSFDCGAAMVLTRHRSRSCAKQQKAANPIGLAA
jgi:hypothetical protein